MSTQATKPDYTKLQDAQLHAVLGSDPAAWSEAALQHANIVGGHITHNFLEDWFRAALGIGVKGEAQASIARTIGELKARSESMDRYEASLDDRAKALEGLEAELVGKMQAFEDRVREADAASSDRPEQEQGGQPETMQSDPRATPQPDHPPSNPEE